MATKLNWVYDDQSAEYRAEHNGYRIRAVRDDDARNPFTDGDCNWPIVVRSGDRHSRDFTCYVDGVETKGIECPIERFNDALILHAQHMIARELGFKDMLACMTSADSDEPVKHCRDADAARGAFLAGWEDVADSQKMDIMVALLKMCEIKALSTTVTGYCQGDWADVLVIAAPEAIEKFGCTEVSDADLQATADLYGSWAWGDVYGYIVEREVPDPDPEADEYREREWEEIEDGSCWGFYGSDFDKSGLEDAALECVPELETADA